MKTHLYLTLIPEALVASNLAPEEFGKYLATGAKTRSRGQAIYFEVSPDVKAPGLNLGEVLGRDISHADGSPHKSKYIAVYRVLEQIERKHLGDLFLATEDGRVLALRKHQYHPGGVRELHLYQEFCPVCPCVASTKEPREFSDFLTTPGGPIHVPRIVFTEMILNGLGADPVHGRADNLPYPNIEHLRDCLQGLMGANAKHTKAVVRHLQQDMLYRTIKNGFFVGDREGLDFYPMPSLEDLENKHYPWWRSALRTRA